MDRMILAPRNTDVDALNDKILERMAGASRQYLSADTVVHEEGVDPADQEPIPIEYLRQLDLSGFPPGCLDVKLGSCIILLRNLDPSRGLCNGTRLYVRRMGDRVIETTIVGGEHHNTVALIPRITLSPGSNVALTFAFQRRQFPVRLAFALSINKSQGQSVKYVGIDLRMPVFAHGQLYVALSRATARENIRVLLPGDTVACRTHNIVYKEVLL
jgi:PIF1-like helicase